MKSMKLKLLAIAVLGFAFSGTANAQATQNIDVTAFVPDVCIFDVTSQDTMTFDLSGVAVAVAPFDTTTTLAWRCSTGYNTDISIGAGSSGNLNNRLVFDGPASLAYNLYTDNTFATVWGDGSGTTATVPVAGTGMSFVGTTTVFGRIQLADAQAAVAGIYLDTVLVTILL